MTLTEAKLVLELAKMVGEVDAGDLKKTLRSLADIGSIGHKLEERDEVEVVLSEATISLSLIIDALDNAQRAAFLLIQGANATLQ